MSVHFSSKSNEWTTPQYLFDELNEEFNFTLDPCQMTKMLSVVNTSLLKMTV